MLARISGGNSGIAEYLETGIKNGRDFSRDELDQRLIIDGDLALTQSVIDSIEDKGQDRYLHITLSFRENEISRETIKAVTEEYKELLLSAYSTDEFNFYAEAHLPKIKSITDRKTGEQVERKPHIHIVIPRKNLLTGKSLNPVGQYDRSIKYFDAIQESINNKYNLESPKDFTRADGDHYANVISRVKGDFFREKHGEIKAELLARIESGEISSYAQFGAELGAFGDVIERNKGKDSSYFAVKIPGDAKFTNLSSPCFNRDFIERKVINFERPTEKQIAARLLTWRESASREIKFIHNANSTFRSEYKRASLAEKRELLDRREADYERRNREPQKGTTGREGNSKPGFEFFGRKDFTGLANGLPGMPERNLVHPIEEFSEAGRVEGFLHDNASDFVGDKQASEHNGLRWSAHREGRGINSDNLPAQLLKTEIEETTRQVELVKFAEIRRNIDPSLLLNSLKLTHGLNPDHYAVTRAKDGSPRIRTGATNLNVSDFLTKHMNMPWSEAKAILTGVYQMQDKSFNLVSEQPDTEKWKDYAKNVAPLRKAEIKEQRQELNAAVKLLKSDSYNIFRDEKSVIYKAIRDQENRKAALSIAIVDRLKREELIKEYKLDIQNTISALTRRSEMEGYSDYANERGYGNMAVSISEPLKRFARGLNIEENSIVKPDAKISIKKNFDLLQSDVATQKSHAEKLRMNDLVAVRQKEGIVEYKSQRDGTTAFEDRGDRLTFNRNAEKDKIALGLELAIAKYGPELKLTGSDDFKKMTAEIAAEKGINVIFKPSQYQDIYLTKKLEISRENENAVSPTPEQQQNKPAPAEVAAPVAQEQPAPAEVAAPVAQEQPAPAEVAAPVAQEQPAPAEVAAPASQEQPAPAEVAAPVAQEQPVPAELADLERDYLSAIDEAKNAEYPDDVIVRYEELTARRTDYLHEHFDPNTQEKLRSLDTQLDEAVTRAVERHNPAPAKVAAPVTLPETRALMEIVANQNKDSQLGMLAEYSLSDLARGKLDSAKEVIGRLQAMEKHPALADQINKATNEMDYYKGQQQQPAPAEVAAPVAQEQRPAPAEVAAPVALPETRALMEIVANQNKDSQLGMLAEYSLSDLARGELGSAKEVIGRLQVMEKHPALADQINKATNEMDYYKGQQQQPAPAEVAAPVAQEQRPAPAEVAAPVALPETRALMEIVANQNKDSQLGMLAEYSLSDLARGELGSAKEVIGRLQVMEKHPALADQINKATNEMDYYKGQQQQPAPAEVAAPVAQEQRPAPAEVAAPVALPETRALMEIVANQNKDSQLGMLAEYSLSDLARGELGSAKEVIGRLQVMEKHPALADQINKATNEMDYYKGQQQQPAPAEVAAPVAQEQRPAPAEVAAPVALPETRALMEIVANQNKDSQLGMLAEYSLSDLARGELGSAKEVIGRLQVMEKHPALADQINKATNEMDYYKGQQQQPAPAEVAAPVAQEQRPAPAEVAAPVALPETRALMEIVANQNKDSQLGMLAEYSLSDLARGELGSAKEVIGRLQVMEKHPALADQINKATNEMDYYKGQQQQPAPAEVAAPVAQEQRPTPADIEARSKENQSELQRAIQLDKLIAEKLKPIADHLYGQLSTGEKTTLKLNIGTNDPDKNSAAMTAYTAYVTPNIERSIKAAKENDPALGSKVRGSVIPLRVKLQDEIQGMWAGRWPEPREPHKLTIEQEAQARVDALITTIRANVPAVALPGDTVKVQFQWTQEGNKFAMSLDGKPAAEAIKERPQLLDALQKNSYLKQFDRETLTNGVIDETGKGAAKNMTLDLATGKETQTEKAVAADPGKEQDR